MVLILHVPLPYVWCWNSDSRATSTVKTVLNYTRDLQVTLSTNLPPSNRTNATVVTIETIVVTMETIVLLRKRIALKPFHYMYYFNGIYSDPKGTTFRR
jgi:hypothetical protein